MELIFHQFLFFLLFIGAHVTCIDGNADIETVDVSCKDSDTFRRYSCTISINATDTTDATYFNITNIHEWKDTTILHLEARDMDILPLGFCQQFPKLRQIYGVGNDFKTIQRESFIGGNELRVIRFWSNKLARLPADLFAFAKKVEKVNFENNSISEIEPYAFDGTDNLYLLHLANNLLTKVERNTFTGAQNVEYLYLGGNLIEIIEDGALNFPKLRFFDLSKNRLQVLSNNLFSGTPVIQILNLAGNCITLVNESLDNLLNLSSLDMSENKVTDLDIRAQARKLTFLTIRDIGLKLEDLVSSGNETYSVKNLDISKNNLSRSDILRYLKNFVNVSWLNLEHNNLTVIEEAEQIPNIFPRLQTIKIVEGNKLGDCEVKTFGDITYAVCWGLVRFNTEQKTVSINL